LTWAVLFLLPGWVLGEAYDAVARGRAAVRGGTLLVLVLAWLVLYGYRWSAAGRGWRACWRGRRATRCWAATPWPRSTRPARSRCRWRCWR
jgi:hypothetical protein